MGRYLNVTTKGFQESVQSEIYVDKTGIIALLNQMVDTEQKYVCVSRPRRFGKSMTIKMLSAYYNEEADSDGLFSDLEIGSAQTYEKYRNRYEVILINMQEFYGRDSDMDSMIRTISTGICRELVRKYSDIEFTDPTNLVETMYDVFLSADKTFILLIDEWDCVFREQECPETEWKKYLDFLRNWMKDKPYISLAYMTGILPIKKYGSHSALNMFTEYSMTNQRELEEYTGFTEEEVKELCGRFDMDIEEVCSWYDGYQLKKVKHVFNPKSVVDAMLCRECSNYWTATETYEALKIYIDMNFDGLRDAVIQMLGGEMVTVDTGNFVNDMRNLHMKDDVLTLLIHLGYLAYDSVEEKAFIPNNEIMGEFRRAMRVGGWENVMKVITDSERLLLNTLEGRETAVAAALDHAHTEIASNLDYNNEFAMGCAVILAYWSARKDYKIIREMPAGYGYADIIFLPLPGRGKPAIVVELKYNKAAQTAIWQIKNKKYADVLKGYSGEVVLVGINYEKDKKEVGHSCKIERAKV